MKLMRWEIERGWLKDSRMARLMRMDFGMEMMKAKLTDFRLDWRKDWQMERHSVIQTD